MERKKKFYISISEEERIALLNSANSNGFTSITKYVRSKVIDFQSPNSSTHKDFRNKRMNVRSIRLEEEFWQQIKQLAENPSAFIRQAILEKLNKN